MKHSAKTIEGIWVTGWYWVDLATGFHFIKHPVKNDFTESGYIQVDSIIDIDTLCLDRGVL